MTTTHTISNLDDADDLAPGFGMADMGEARFPREALGAERVGLGHYLMRPGRRVGFGHRHDVSEEIYLVLAGSGRFKLDDEIVDVGPRDMVYCPPATVREWEAGPDGMEVLAFGGHAENESHMDPGFWPAD
ncbi:hypothetical protein DSM112329_01934 [Paraconexibacter sp. AEG42_29]|uniref:Cupin type-2 domain-containing protein n=1 Tax=Paraconexibacter sp. AEG42_29 TaxID=2997339 RepID=A0AAU7ATZ6_9ACTN